MADGCELHVVDHRAQVEDLARRARVELDPLLEDAARSALHDTWLGYLAGGHEWRYRPAVLHADISPEHVLVDPLGRQITGIFDWGDLMIGDPARDLIYIYEDWGPDFLSSVIAYYDPEHADSLLRRVRFHYIVAQVEWTVAALQQGSTGDAEFGIRSINAELLAGAGRN